MFIFTSTASLIVSFHTVQQLRAAGNCPVNIVGLSPRQVRRSVREIEGMAVAYPAG